MNKDFHAKKPKIKLTVIFKACTCKTDKGDKINFKNSCENALNLLHLNGEKNQLPNYY